MKIGEQHPDWNKTIPDSVAYLSADAVDSQEVAYLEVMLTELRDQGVTLSSAVKFCASLLSGGAKKVCIWGNYRPNGESQIDVNPQDGTILSVTHF